MTTQPWEILRPLTDIANQTSPYIKIIVALFSIALFIVALLAYRKKPSKRLLFVALAFFFFAIKWLVKVIDIFISPGAFLADSSENVFELAILALLFFAIIKK